MITEIKNTVLLLATIISLASAGYFYGKAEQLDRYVKLDTAQCSNVEYIDEGLEPINPKGKK